MITKHDLDKVNTQLEAAQEDDTPFLVVTDDEMTVAGDPNKTGNKKHSYEITFRYPASMKSRFKDGYREEGPFIYVPVTFDEITLTPRDDIEVVRAIVAMQPFVKKMQENGNVDEYTEEEQAEVIRYFSKDVEDAFYNLVKVFLGVPSDMVDYMQLDSVINTVCQLITDFPEVFNEADAFFG